MISVRPLYYKSRAIKYRVKRHLAAVMMSSVMLSLVLLLHVTSSTSTTADTTHVTEEDSIQSFSCSSNSSAAGDDAEGDDLAAAYRGLRESAIESMKSIDKALNALAQREMEDPQLITKLELMKPWVRGLPEIPANIDDGDVCPYHHIIDTDKKWEALPQLEINYTRAVMFATRVYLDQRDCSARPGTEHECQIAGDYSDLYQQLADTRCWLMRVTGLELVPGNNNRGSENEVSSSSSSEESSTSALPSAAEVIPENFREAGKIKEGRDPRDYVFLKNLRRIIGLVEKVGFQGWSELTNAGYKATLNDYCKQHS